MSEEQIKTLQTITHHVRLVQKYLLTLAGELEKRAYSHDISKLSNDEFEGFVKVNQVARTRKYGSSEYEKALDSVEPNPIALHYQRNSHHPEHYENGVNDMSLLDIVEMVCDWKAASQTYGQTSFRESLKISAERFGLNEGQLYLILLIANTIEVADER
jgi:hypothetical protein